MRPSSPSRQCSIHISCVRRTFYRVSYYTGNHPEILESLISMYLPFIQTTVPYSQVVFFDYRHVLYSTSTSFSFDTRVTVKKHVPNELNIGKVELPEIMSSLALQLSSSRRGITKFPPTRALSLHHYTMQQDHDSFLASPSRCRRPARALCRVPTICP
ncbi:hypothetical protein EDB19DRAFT_78257 [Suillus lakei]|nr:hypothetical protein EDB19DRAFT_78257 [Suillus lakei]